MWLSGVLYRLVSSYTVVRSGVRGYCLSSSRAVWFGWTTMTRNETTCPVWCVAWFVSSVQVPPWCCNAVCCVVCLVLPHWMHVWHNTTQHTAPHRTTPHRCAALHMVRNETTQHITTQYETRRDETTQHNTTHHTACVVPCPLVSWMYCDRIR